MTSLCDITKAKTENQERCCFRLTGPDGHWQCWNSASFGATASGVSLANTCTKSGLKNLMMNGKDGSINWGENGLWPGGRPATDAARKAYFGNMGFDKISDEDLIYCPGNPEASIDIVPYVDKTCMHFHEDSGQLTPIKCTHSLDVAKSTNPVMGWNSSPETMASTAKAVQDYKNCKGKCEDCGKPESFTSVNFPLNDSRSFGQYNELGSYMTREYANKGRMGNFNIDF